MKKSVPWLAGGAYILAVHAVLLILCYKTDAMAIIDKNLGFAPARPELNSFHQSMVDYQSRLDDTLMPGAVLFIGASHMQSLDVSSIAERAVNYGIGGDTIADVMERLPVYRSLRTARAVVLEVGYNDLRFHSVPRVESDYQSLLAALPAYLPVVVSAVLPIDETAPAFLRWPGRNNDNIARLNKALARFCSARPPCAFADAGPQLRDRAGRLAAIYRQADGVHLSPAGYRFWSMALADALARLSPANLAAAH